MIKERFDLSGKLALVTGSSQGIGKAIALGLAEFGADVVVLYHSDRKEGQEVITEIEKMGRKAYLHKSDLGKATAARKLFDDLKEKKLRVDILVVNASIQVAKDWKELTEKEFDKQVNANFKSTLFLFQLFIPPMLKKKWGRVLTIGSVQQQKPHPAMIAYAATKSAVENMVKNLALQVAAQGVTINNLAPGVIGTPRLDESVPEVDEEIGIRMATPMNTIGDPEDCATVALLLCSEAGRFITGQTYYVDGGMSL